MEAERNDPSLVAVLLLSNPLRREQRQVVNFNELPRNLYARKYKIYIHGCAALKYILVL